MTARGVDFNSPSASDSDVISTLALANNGDRVFVFGPANVIWSSTPNIHKSIQLIATNGVTVTRTNSGKILTCGTTDMVRVSGFTFVHGGNSSSDSCVYFQGQGVCIDNCVFLSSNDTKKMGVYPDGNNTLEHPNGVIAHCHFFRTRILTHSGGICVTPPGCTVASLEWDSVPRLGTTNQVVIEDCTFEQVTKTLYNSTDSEYAGSYTVRFSDFTNTTAEAHSNGSSVNPQERASRTTEIYGNRFHQVAPVVLNGLAGFMRGGSGGFWSNTISGTWPSISKTLKLDAERGWSKAGGGGSINDGNSAIYHHGTGSAQVASSTIMTDNTATWASGELVTGTGVAAFWLYNLSDGSKGQITANTASTITTILSGGTANTWKIGDNYKITGGYPLRDQVGTIRDTFQWNVNLNPPPQLQQPLIFFHNILNGNPSFVFVDPSSVFWLVEGRDFSNTLPTWPFLQYPHPLYTFYAGGGGNTNVNYTITTSSSPSIGGSTSGGGIHAGGSSVTVVATPNFGYDFINWTESGNPVSTSASYNFTITADRTLVANFLFNPPPPTNGPPAIVIHPGINAKVGLKIRSL